MGQQYIFIEQIAASCSMASYIVTSLTTLGYPDFIFAKECQKGILLEILVIIVLGKNKIMFHALRKKLIACFEQSDSRL